MAKNSDSRRRPYMFNTITIPSGLEGFINTNTTIANTVTDRSI